MLLRILAEIVADFIRTVAKMTLVAILAILILVIWNGLCNGCWGKLLETLSKLLPAVSKERI